MPELNCRDAINLALAEEMRRDPDVLVLGEDVGEYGGSFKVTRGLMEEFGRERVIDTPISEAAIIGAAIGMAMTGLRPVPELMTVNFALVAWDQIVNHLAMARYMFGGQCTLPVTVRAPGGGGHQLGAQHSHSLEAALVHTPGLKVVYPCFPADYKALLAASIRDDNPVMFLEHEGMYNTTGEVPEDLPPSRLGEARVIRDGGDLTLVAYGGMTMVASEAAEDLAAEGIAAEVIDLRTLRPWDTDTVLASVGRTHRVVVVEEGWPQCGFAAEVIATIQERIFDELDAPIARVSGADVPMPYAKDLEQACIPDRKKVTDAAKSFF